jgi:hypothetical protein
VGGSLAADDPDYSTDWSVVKLFLLGRWVEAFKVINEGRVERRMG